MTKLCLGIESTAHTFGVGIVDEKCNVLANEKSQLTTTSGGILPREAAEQHLRQAKYVIQRALQKANVKFADVDVIAFSIGPGLGPCLAVGAVATRTLALRFKQPIVGVNHPIAHIEIGKKVCGAKDPLVMYASGGNTQIIGFAEGKYRVFGETLDIGVGNMLDSFGREIGLGFPAGPAIDEMYFQAKNFVELPYSVKGMDLAYSGLQTAAELKIDKVDKIDLAHSLMHTAFAMLCEVTERALAHTKKKELLLTGGVACSKALQKMAKEMAEPRGVKVHITPRPLAVDNGAMIAWAGLQMFKAGNKLKLEQTQIIPKYRPDQVDVNWH